MDLGGFTCKVLMTEEECTDNLVLSITFTVLKGSSTTLQTQLIEMCNRKMIDF